MKNNYSIIYLSILYIILLTACNQTSNTSSKYASITEQSNVSTEFETIVFDWNMAHHIDKIQLLEKLFDNSVLYYGKQMSKEQCIDAKRSYLHRFKDFEQEIIGSVTIQNISKEEVKCSFVKRVSQKGEKKNYDAYLVLKKKNDRWYITSESDELTDNNLATSNKNKVHEDAVQGDFDGDGILEYMWLEKPKTIYGEMDCEGDCNCYIVFSNSNLPKIKIENCIDGNPVNEGDINNDGADEIGLLPTWFTSCWMGYRVWTFHAGRWRTALDEISTHCNQWEQGIHPIEKDSNNPGYVIIHFSEFKEDDIIVSSKKVKVR